MLLCLTLLFACGETPEVKERFERYENGVVSRHYTSINGLKQGALQDYYPSGKLMAKRQFVDDKETARSLIFYENGALKEVQYYKNGLKNGGDTIWYAHGPVQFTASFIEDKKNGPFQKWAPDGTLLFEAIYQQDSLIRVTKEMIKHQ